MIKIVFQKNFLWKKTTGSRIAVDQWIDMDRSIIIIKILLFFSRKVKANNATEKERLWIICIVISPWTNGVARIIKAAVFE